MPRRRRHFVTPPRLRPSGPALAEAIDFSAHALDRFAQRGPDDVGGSDEPALRLLITRQGAVLTRPPAWFHGSAGRGVLVGIAGRFVIPLVRAPIRDGALPARPWLAVTFISRDLGPDLARLSGEDLAALAFLPQRVVDEWAVRTTGSTAASSAGLRAALAAIPAGSPKLVTRPAAAAGRDELRVALGGGTLVLIRADRREGHGARLRATAWVARPADV